MKCRSIAALAVVMLSVGSIAFAQRVVPYSYRLSDTGVFLTTCGDFDVLYDDVEFIHGVWVYDQGGLRKMRVLIVSTVGQTTYYNSTDPQKFVMGGPGEVQTARTLFDNGVRTQFAGGGDLFRIVLPGYGPIYLESGHFVYDFVSGEFVFASGPNQFVEGDAAALCEYLR